MAAVMNGIALHGGFIPYGGTFLTFSDYSRNAIRMAALMKTRVVHVFTHDSIGLGEDGPTHQSIEHAASLRLIPGLDVWRPCDTAETAIAWACAIESRDAAERAAAVAAEPRLCAEGRARRDREGRLRAGRAERGRLAQEGAGGDHRDRLRGAAGAARAAAARRRRHRGARRLDAVDDGVRPPDRSPTRKRCCRAGVPRIAVEMGVTDGWWKYGCAAVVGIDRFGESAPAPALFRHFGFTAENVAATVRAGSGSAIEQID